MKILIADDHANTRQILRRVLTGDLGAEIHEAPNGLAVLEALSEGHFDLLILDIEMAPLGGLETLDALRRVDAHRSLPVIMVSGLATADAVRHVKALGVAGFVSKPLSPRILRERVVPLIRKCLPDKVKSLPPSTTTIAQPLTLQPSSRIWLVGGDRHFWGAAHADLAAVCQVSHWSTPIKAAQQASMGRPDIIFVSALLSDLLTPSTFAKAVRTTSRTVRMVLCGAVSDVDGDSRALFDAEMPFNEPPTLDMVVSALRRHVTAASLAPLLSRPEPPAIQSPAAL